MEFKCSQYEAIQFRVNRTLTAFEFAKVLEASLGGPGIVRFLRKKLRLPREKFDVPDWGAMGELDRNRYVVTLAMHVVCLDPAEYLGFPELDEEEKEGAAKLYCAGLEGKLDKDALEQFLIGNAERCIRALNEANKGIIARVEAMSLFEIENFANTILSQNDETLRWRTLWALVVDPKITRLEAMSILKYSDAGKVIADFPYVYRPASEGGSGLSKDNAFSPFNEADAAKSLLMYRAHILGAEFTPEFIMTQTNMDLVTEIRIYNETAASSLKKIAEREGIISEQGKLLTAERGENSRLRSQNSGLQTRIGDLESELRLEKSKTSPAVPKPKISKKETYASTKLQEAQDEIQSLRGQLKAQERTANELPRRLQTEQRITAEYKERDILRLIYYAMQKFYTGKRIALISREGFNDKYANIIREFGAAVEVRKVTGKIRQVSALADSNVDIIFAPMSNVDHTVSKQLADRNVIFYEKRECSVPEALYRCMLKLTQKAL